MIVLGKTHRGFLSGDFQDSNGNNCSIQESSLVEPRLWFGRDSVLGEPGRMHLTQQQAADLIPLLQRFVETGRLQ